MKKRKITVLALTVLSIGGCESIPDQFARSANNFANQVGEEYVTYVANDDSLTPEQKQIRFDRVTAQQNLTAEAINGD